jgi:LysR family transcriptional regulator, glycine cleavage system transcriptional activator
MRRRLLPTIGELVAFESAGRHGSFTRAALELNLTQSAVSRQIRLLEERIGAALFERVRQRVVLTAAGRLYLQEVGGILQRLNDSTRQVMSQADAAAILNIAVLPSFATRWLMPRMAEFTSLHPGTTINFSSRIKPFDFTAEPFDAAILYGVPTYPNVIAHRLMDEHIVPVCSPEFRVRHSISSPEDLTRVVLLHQVTRPMAWMNWFDSVGIGPDHGGRGPTYEHFAMIVQAAVGGLGAALVPRFLAEDELQSGQLELLFDHSLKSEGAYYVFVPEINASSPPVRRFVDWVLSHAPVAADGVSQ